MNPLSLDSKGKRFTVLATAPNLNTGNHWTSGFSCLISVSIVPTNSFLYSSFLLAPCSSLIFLDHQINLPICLLTQHAELTNEEGGESQRERGRAKTKCASCLVFLGCPSVVLYFTPDCAMGIVNTYVLPLCVLQRRCCLMFQGM